MMMMMMMSSFPLSAESSPLQCRRLPCARQECYHGAFGTGPPNYRRVSLVRPEALCNYYDCNALDISLSWPTVPFEELRPRKDTLCVNYIKCVPRIVKEDIGRAVMNFIGCCACNHCLFFFNTGSAMPFH